MFKKTQTFLAISTKFQRAFSERLSQFIKMPVIEQKENIKKIACNVHRKVYPHDIQYGTAGFRTKAEYLDHVMYRMGLLAVLRSQFKKAAIGLMITASHNPEEDNGIKMVDPAGEMLESSWEDIATCLANVEDTEVTEELEKIISDHNIDTNFSAQVILGRDTRKSSLKLSVAAAAGIQAMGGQVNDFDVVTTPQLHYLVVCNNTGGEYGTTSLPGYYDKFCSAFKKVRGDRNRNHKNYEPEVILDAANGVGAKGVKDLKEVLESVLDIQIYNDGDGKLNHMCGADYVKIQQAPPSNVPHIPFKRCISIDGDADRIVYYYTDDQNKFHLLDGDRIATLIASYFQKLVADSELDIKLGIVQTAYANGGSTEYICKELKIPVTFADTGVKHLHERAHEYEVGIYFEANGHGTVLFRNSAIEKIKQATKNNSLTQTQKEAISTLLNSIDIVNQAVGDALSDMLLVETILHIKGWNAVDWKKSYDDLPNKQVKIKVQNRSVITTTDAARKCLTPVGLQEEINKIVSKYSKGRSFVRPSGTEDVVRVYAEAKYENDVEKLSAEVSLAVYNMAGGIGPKPAIP